MVQLPWENVYHFLIKVNVHLPKNSTPNVYLREMKTYILKRLVPECS